jgi:hypothetical protein
MTPTLLEQQPIEAWHVRRAAVRFLVGGVVLGQVWLPFDHLNRYRSLFRVEMVDGFFPAWLREPWLPTLSCVAMLLSCAYTFVRPTRRASAWCALSMLLGSAVHLLHQRTFFAQEFATRFWAALWLLWLVKRRDESEATRQSGATLASLLCSLVFLGGAVGKWTSSYWSGEVMADLVFRAPTAGFTWLREQLSPAELSTVARWYSRTAIVGETLMACTALLPPRIGLRLFLLLLSAMYLASPWTILEALTALFGLCLAGLCLLLPARADTHGSRTRS